MTPRIEPERIEVGDRVEDKRSSGRFRAGRGTVVALSPASATVRWDGGERDGVRALSMLKKVVADA